MCRDSLSPFCSDWFPKEISQCFPSIFQTSCNMEQEFQKLSTRIKEECKRFLEGLSYLTGAGETPKSMASLRQSAVVHLFGNRHLAMQHMQNGWPSHAQTHLAQPQQLLSLVPWSLLDRFEGLCEKEMAWNIIRNQTSLSCLWKSFFFPSILSWDLFLSQECKTSSSIVLLLNLRLWGLQSNYLDPI